MSENESTVNNIRRYDHLYARVEYPAERGYRMESSPLPPWMHITITETTHSKYLTVYSRIHVNKEVKVDPSYSKAFDDRAIIIDLSGKIAGMFL